MRTSLIVMAIVAVCCMIACKSKTNSNKQNTPGIATSKLNKQGTDQLLATLNTYYKLKDAFAYDKEKEVEATTIQLMNNIIYLEAALKKDEAAGPELQSYIDSMRNGAKTMMQLKPPALEEKRIYFQHISDAMHALLMQSEMKNIMAYRQYCPMAFNDEGAYWLSDNTEIRNPYFGKKMLECGEVVDTLK